MRHPRLVSIALAISACPTAPATVPAGGSPADRCAVDTAAGWFCHNGADEGFRPYLGPRPTRAAASRSSRTPATAGRPSTAAPTPSKAAAIENYRQSLARNPGNITAVPMLERPGPAAGTKPQQ